jgi:broad specificity phosphatase PhoE
VLPRDLILVRHGQSEGNVAAKSSRAGDHGFFTAEHRNRHSRDFRLTDKGIAQARAAGEWLRSNLLPLRSVDRFYVSDYIRAKETAGLLNLPNALWRVEFNLRERDMGLIDNLSDEEKRTRFPLEQEQYEKDPFLSIPAGGGESFAAHCLRLKAGMMEHWARKCFSASVIAVCHGHVMRAIQVEVEGLGHDDFIRLDASEESADKIRNCQIFWYSRIDPDTSVLAEYPVAVRSVSPSEGVDYGWRRIKRPKFTNDQLLVEVERYPRFIAGCEPKS